MLFNIAARTGIFRSQCEKEHIGACALAVPQHTLQRSPWPTCVRHSIIRTRTELFFLFHVFPELCWFTSKYLLSIYGLWMHHILKSSGLGSSHHKITTFLPCEWWAALRNSICFLRTSSCPFLASSTCFWRLSNASLALCSLVKNLGCTYKIWNRGRGTLIMSSYFHIGLNATYVYKRQLVSQYKV